MDNLIGAGPQPIPGSHRARLIVVALLCILFLLNLTGGWIAVPDFLPIIGNPDEVAATVVLMRCLERMGIYPMPEC